MTMAWMIEVATKAHVHGVLGLYMLKQRPREAAACAEALSRRGET